MESFPICSMELMDEEVIEPEEELRGLEILVSNVRELGEDEVSKDSGDQLVDVEIVVNVGEISWELETKLNEDDLKEVEMEGQVEFKDDFGPFSFLISFSTFFFSCFKLL